jgi:integrase/recombinase XerD
MLAQGMSIYTVKAFDSDLGLLASFVGNRTPISSIGTTRLEDFLGYLREGRGVPCKLKSLERRLTALKVFFAWLTEGGSIAADPAAALIHHRATTPLARILTEAEIAQLLAATDGQRHDAKRPDARPRLLVTLLLATGIKKGECMNIALTDFLTTDPANPSVFIRYESARQHFKERRLRLPADFSAALSEYQSQHQPKVRLFECTARNLEYVLDDCSQRAGLPGRVVSFEALRWTCAVRDQRQGMSEDDLRRKLGLSRISWVETAEKLKRLAQPAL